MPVAFGAPDHPAGQRVLFEARPHPDGVDDVRDQVGTPLVPWFSTSAQLALDLLVGAWKVL